MSAIIKVLMTIAFVVFVMTLGSHVASSHDADDYVRLEQDAEALRENNAALKASNAALRAHIEALRNDPRVIEQHARDALKMVRRDEVLLLLNQPEVAPR